MSDNVTKIILHIDNNTGKVIKAEQEDVKTGELTEAIGNFEAITLKQADSVGQIGWRVGEPAPEEEDDDTTSAASTSADAPKV